MSAITYASCRNGRCRYWVPSGAWEAYCCGQCQNLHTVGWGGTYSDHGVSCDRRTAAPSGGFDPGPRVEHAAGRPFLWSCCIILLAVAAAGAFLWFVSWVLGQVTF